MIGEIARTEQALFLGRRREEIDVAVGPRALAQPLFDLDQHRDPARFTYRAVADSMGLALRPTTYELGTMAAEKRRLAVGLGARRPGQAGWSGEGTGGRPRGDALD